MRSGSKRGGGARASTGWGGARANAGRPASGPIASEPHKQRPALSPRHPVHVVARVMRPWRPNRAYRSIQRALKRSLARADFRIIALVVRKRRLELVIEADSALALARGMQGFQVAAARHWNRSCGRTGAVFPDRYRPRALRTRGEVRAAVAAMRISRRLAWPATYLLQIELVPFVTMDCPADPDP